MEDRDSDASYRWHEGGANVIACAVRQPTRGLMTLRLGPEVSSQHGVSALVEEMFKFVLVASWRCGGDADIVVPIITAPSSEFPYQAARYREAKSSCLLQEMLTATCRLPAMLSRRCRIACTRRCRTACKTNI